MRCQNYSVLAGAPGNERGPNVSGGVHWYPLEVSNLAFAVARMVTAATAEMRVDPVAGLHDEEAAGDMQQEDALALALLNEDEAGGEDATTTARRLRPLYPPGQYPLHESICDIWYRCCTCCKRLKCSKLCWKLTCRLCMDWLAKESAYLTSSPRIVHAFAASCFAAIVLAIITGSAGGEWTMFVWKFRV
jgi:hypothetical protein